MLAADGERFLLLLRRREEKEGAETSLHLQLACKLKSRRAARQGAHDNVAGTGRRSHEGGRKKGGMGHQGTGPVLTGNFSRGERDIGEKIEGANRRTKNGRRFREPALRDAKHCCCQDSRIFANEKKWVRNKFDFLKLQISS